jgi:hypothetical protein
MGFDLFEYKSLHFFKQVSFSIQNSEFSSWGRFWAPKRAVLLIHRNDLIFDV